MPPDLIDLLLPLFSDPRELIFRALLLFHVPAGLTCVVTGAMAMMSQKRRGRHPTMGRLYYRALVVLWVSAVGLSVVHWPEDAYLLVLGSLALGCASLGYVARRRRWPGWTTAHIVGMSLSYVVLLTAFYVDNGPNLPLWNRLPVIAFWIGPSLIGMPLLLRALRRNTRPREDTRLTLQVLGRALAGHTSPLP